MEKDIQIRSTYVEMTPELAQKYLDTQIHNRNINYGWVASLAQTINKGLWIPDGNSIKMDDAGHLIDGQHRLLAVIRSGKTVPMEVKSGFPHDAIFVIDAFTKPRSVADILTLAGVKNSALIGGGIRVFVDEMGGGGRSCRVSPSYIKMVYEESPDMWQRIASLANLSRRDHKNQIKLLPTSSIAGWAGYLIIMREHSYEKVEEFFTMLCSTSEARNVSVEKLRKVLLRNAVSSKKYTYSVIRSLVAKTWNAYVTGKTIKCLKFSKDEENVQFI